MLDLYFEASDSHIDARGGHRYVLYKDGDKYPLPDVVLVTQQGTATVPLQEVSIVEASIGGGDGIRDNSQEASRLRAEIQSAWSPQEQTRPGPVVARHVVAQGRAVPADAVGKAAAADRVVRAYVTWRYRYTGETGVTNGRMTARLEFAPPSTSPPAHRTAPDAKAELLGVPAPVRSVGIRPTYRYFAAIDFGTSSSTVTLYDARVRVARGVDPGQAETLGDAIIRLLKDEAPGPVRERWRQATADLATRVGREYPQLEGADTETLCGRLLSFTPGDGNTGKLLDIVCANLDRIASEDAYKDLANWLGARILSCYDEAFNQPPLATLNLRPVLLDTKYGHEIPTVVTITSKSPVDIGLGAEQPDSVRNLKAKLGEPEPLDEGTAGIDHADATTDNLIALVYKTLIDRTEQFAMGEDPNAPDEALTSLIATFPTTTPAGTRRHLTQMLEYSLDLKEVSVDYDEGVAAALYFLMRDFSGTRPEFGAEALRARSRQVSATPPQWQQNMLVVDIGAGTTDIALLRLTLIDDTSPIPGVDPAVQGRYYIVQPEIINSTGHPQLGGNYLTLRVFYWVKAAIIDAMLTPDGNPDKSRDLANRVRAELGLGAEDEIPALAPLVARSGEVQAPVPPRVAPALSALLPTHWGRDDEASAKDAFWLLWEIAEAAKIALGKGDSANAGPHVVPQDKVARVLTAIDPSTSTERAALLPEAGVPLPRADFQALARPVIAHAAELAWWLVQHSLGGDDDDKLDRLDRVMLSGKTSIMDMTRSVIAEELGSRSTGTRVSWNPTAISVERRYAKQAASIGAAWAAQIKARLAGEEQERDQLAMGRSVLKINVDNVFNSLPCEFVLLRSQEQSSTLFAAGTPLAEIDKAGTLAARQEWTDSRPWPALVRAFEVHRPVQPNKTQVWGTYRYMHDAKEERGFTPDPRVWEATAMGDSGSRIRAQVQIDQRLNPTLNICQGRPHYLVIGGETVKSVNLRQHLPEDCFGYDGLRMLPGALVLVGAPDKQHPTGEAEPFPIWLPEAGTPVSSYFPDYFHDQAGLDSDAIAGSVAFTLPPPAPGGVYRLLLRKPGSADREIGGIKVPAYGERTVRYTATLDVQGLFALHRGSPPYWMAGTLRDVEAHPGAVLHRAMEPGKDNRNPQWDPFTGRH